MKHNFLNVKISLLNFLIIGFIGLISLSCSSSKSASYAFMDDIYKPVTSFNPSVANKDLDYGAVSNQKASVVRSQNVPENRSAYPYSPASVGRVSSFYTSLTPFYFAYDNFYRSPYLFTFNSYDPFWFNYMYCTRGYHAFYPNYSINRYGSGYDNPLTQTSSRIRPNPLTDGSHSYNYSSYANYRVTESQAKTLTRQRGTSKSTYQSSSTKSGQKRFNVTPSSSRSPSMRSGGSNSSTRSTGSSSGSYSGKRFK